MDLANITNILQSMTGNTGQRVAQIENQAAQMTANTAQIENFLSANMAEAPAVADAAAAIARQEATVQHRVQSQIQQYQALYGLDPDDLNNAVAQGMAEFNAAEDARKEARARYDRVASQDFLSNPVGYILGQLQLPSLVAENNAQVARRNAAEQNMLARKNLLREFKSTVVANTADEALQINLARADQSRKIAEMELREANAAMLSKIGGMKLQEWQHRNSIFAVQDAAFAKQLQVAQWQMNLEIRQEEMEDRRQRAAEIAKAKELEAEDEAQLNLQLQRVSQFLGLRTPMTTNTLRRMSQPARESWIMAALNGKVGADLGDGLQFISEFGDTATLAETNPGVERAVRSFQNSLASYEAQLNRQIQSGATPAIPATQRRAKAVEMYMQDIVDAANLPGSGNSLTSSRWQQVFNPYRAQYASLVTEVREGTKAGLADNIVVKQLATVMGDEIRDITAEEEQTVLKAIAIMVRNGDIGPQDAAAQISQFYTVSALKNRELFQYDLFNLPAQTRYMGQIPAARRMGEPINVDLMNTSQVERALLEAVLFDERVEESMGRIRRRFTD